MKKGDPHNSEAFIVLVILISHLEVPDQESLGGLQVVELFAGIARIARFAHWVGLKSRACDLTFLPVRNPYKKKRGKLPRGAMDLNGSAGFVPLGLFWDV